MARAMILFLFTLALSATAARYEQLGKHFDVKLDSDRCGIEITAGPKNTTVFVSDDRLLTTGFGNVDDVEIMVDGNVVNFPRPQNKTSYMVCDSFDNQENQLTITGNLHGPQDFTLPFKVTFSQLDQNRIGFVATVPGAHSSAYGTNFLAMTYASPPDEEIYGMGLEYTVWNFKGHEVPLIVNEGGVGRGQQPITMWENMHGGQGGSAVTSYGPTPNYITNKNRGFLFNTTDIGIADFKAKDSTSFLFWHAKKLEGVIMYGDGPLELAQLSAQNVGLMPELPAWVHQGAILGVVGGQTFVDKTYSMMKSAGVKLSGIWMQDWVGQHKFPEGTRLLWNWALNREWYPEWDRMVDEWAKDNVKPLVYFNPYIANLTEFVTGQNLFQEGCQGDYFVKNKDGEVYLINSISINFAIVDFTNTAACKWFGQVLVDNGVKTGKSGGWMHDFGEYLPFDAVLFDGSDPVKYHNKYAEDWAKLAHDYLADYPDVVPFMRAASTTSPKYTRLFWMGDQLEAWDRYDGMQSAMIGLLNSGLSGFTMGHSDIGGYTSTTVEIFGVKVLKYYRDKIMLHRWIEMSTFSDIVMRSHPGNDPDENYQIWDDPETVQFFKNFTDIHVALSDYKTSLAKEATSVGTPITRPLLLHFPHSPAARAENSEFLLGPNILVAPIFDGRVNTRRVYLPGPAKWTNIWTGETHEVDAEGMRIEKMYAYMGRPAVFVRSTEEYPFGVKAFIEKIKEIFGL